VAEHPTVPTQLAFCMNCNIYNFNLATKSMLTSKHTSNKTVNPPETSRGVVNHVDFLNSSSIK